MGFCCQYSSVGSVGFYDANDLNHRPHRVAQRGREHDRVANLEIERILRRLADNGFHPRSAIFPDDLVGGHSSLQERDVTLKILNMLEVSA